MGATLNISSCQSVFGTASTLLYVPGLISFEIMANCFPSNKSILRSNCCKLDSIKTLTNGLSKEAEPVFV